MTKALGLSPMNVKIFKLIIIFLVGCTTHSKQATWCVDRQNEDSPCISTNYKEVGYRVVEFWEIEIPKVKETRINIGHVKKKMYEFYPPGTSFVLSPSQKTLEKDPDYIHGQKAIQALIINEDGGYKEIWFVSAGSGRKDIFVYKLINDETIFVERRWVVY